MRQLFLRWVYLLLLLGCMGANGATTAPLKPRIIVLTDISPAHIEPDDMESLIRLLVYADTFEIEGLVATTGWSSSGNNSGWTNLIHEVINAYAMDLPNLQLRSNQKGHQADESRQELGYWPSPAYLHSRTLLGSQKRGVSFLGAGNDSPGSELIIRTVDEKDERPVWILAWGGANTLAQAIWRVRESRPPEQLKQFLHKLRVYAITDQDRGYEAGTPFETSSHQWLRREFEQDLLFLWDESAWMYQNGTGKARWDTYAAEIQGHGNLGKAYPKYRFGVEGDTPSFLYVLPNGLNDPAHPGHGGWGGYFEWGSGPDKITRSFVNQKGTKAQAISRQYETRFYPAIFNDFAARMDWAKEGKGNRNPVIKINGETGLEPLRLNPVPGSTVPIDASASFDPDGNKLSFSWWILPEAGTYTNGSKISENHASQITVEVPKDSAGKSFHLICEVTDDGTPPLTSYRRIIFQPAERALDQGNKEGSTRPRVVIMSDFPPLDVIPVGAGTGPANKRSDPDDLQSMVRFLLYANEFEVEGLIASAATLANVADKQNIMAMLNLYEQVEKRLQAKDARYPTARQLRAVTWQGRTGTYGKPSSEIIGEGKDSEASEAIIKLVDQPDPRPVWFCVWGGPADLAQAIWKVKATRTPAGLEKFLAKMRVYLIAKQDGSAQWLLDQFPRLFVIVSQKNYMGMFWNAYGADPKLADLKWITENIRQGHGPLAAAYPESGANPKTPGVIEGDTPSFLYLVSGVLKQSDPENPSQGSWGGKFIQPDAARNHWFDDPVGDQCIWRWRSEVQADFARRLDWMKEASP